MGNSYMAEQGVEIENRKNKQIRKRIVNYIEEMENEVKKRNLSIFIKEGR